MGATVLVVMRSGRWRGGAEWALWHLLEHGRTEGTRWIVAFLEQGALADDVRRLGVDVHVLPAGRMRHPQRGLQAIAGLYRIIRRERVELVLGWMADSHVYAAPAAAAARVPAVWFQHWVPRPSWVDRLATALPAREVLAASGAIAEAQARVPPRRPVRVIHPGVDVRRFAAAALPGPREARALLGLPELGPLVGMIGRLEAWKGPHVLVEAMPAVLRHHPEAHCVLVGDVHDRVPEYGAFLRARIASLDLERRVTLAGAQPNPELWMTAMDVVVHASDNEPFGIVVLEALALGKAVVAGAEGGPSEIITDGVEGVLAPYGDHRALASAIVGLLDDPVRAARLGTAGRERAAAFSAQAFADKVVAALLDRSPSSTPDGEPSVLGCPRERSS